MVYNLQFRFPIQGIGANKKQTKKPKNTKKLCTCVKILNKILMSRKLQPDSSDAEKH